MRLINCASPHSDIVYVPFGSLNSSVLDALDDLGMVWGINESDPELLPPDPESIKAHPEALELLKQHGWQFIF